MADLAQPDDVEARLGRDLTAAELGQVNAYLSDASALVRDEGLEAWDPDDVDNLPPAIIVGIVSSMVRRALSNPEGFVSETIGDYSYRRPDVGQVSTPSGGVTMTRAEVRQVRRAASRSNVVGVGIRKGLAYERDWLRGAL